MLILELHCSVLTVCRSDGARESTFGDWLRVMALDRDINVLEAMEENLMQPTADLLKVLPPAAPLFLFQTTKKKSLSTVDVTSLTVNQDTLTYTLLDHDGPLM